MFKIKTEYGNLSTEILRLNKECKKEREELKVLQLKVLELNESIYKKKKLLNTTTDDQNNESSEESDGQFDQKDEIFHEIEEISDDNESITDDIKDIDVNKICENIEKKLEKLKKYLRNIKSKSKSKSENENELTLGKLNQAGNHKSLLGGRRVVSSYSSHLSQQQVDSEIF
ncbi:hypothetical protein M0804_006572 [Polistes exclamans]|nr:hypothetical protein M0804_006572 [Polistes exclamans]